MAAKRMHAIFRRRHVKRRALTAGRFQFGMVWRLALAAGPLGPKHSGYTPVMGFRSGSFQGRIRPPIRTARMVWALINR